MQELRLQVVVLDPKDRRRVENAVAFGPYEAGADALVYPKEEPLRFYEDLIMGRPLPLTLITSGLDKLGVLIVMAAFLSREMAVHPATWPLLTAADLVDRHQLAGLAHIDRDLARFFVFLGEYLPPGLPQREQETRIASVITWIRQFVMDGALPAMPSEPPLPREIQRGTDGFVVAETPVWRNMDLSWVELFRQGHLRGVLFGAPQKDRQLVLAARKSVQVHFDLERAARVLNEAERAMGEAPAWRAEALWLAGPPEGTLLLAPMVLEVLLRV